MEPPLMNTTSPQPFSGTFSSVSTSGFLSNEFIEYSTRIIFVALNGVTAFFGIIFNIINIIVFWKQGFAEVVNMSLFALAVADLGSLLGSFVQSICYNIWITELVPHINFRHVQYVSAAYFKTAFGRVASFITAFVSFERCLCIIIPLKVKVILTKRVSLVALASIYIPIMASFVTTFYSLELAPKFIRSLNKTVVSLKYRHGKISRDHESNFLLVISLYQIVAFCMVVLFTIILIFKVNSKSKWRQKTVTSDQAEAMLTRDRKVIKMVLIISISFIICFIPTVTQLIAMHSFSQYGVIGPYRNMYVFLWSVAAFGDITSATINIFFYYRMSSRYAAIMDTILPVRFFKKAQEEKK